MREGKCQWIRNIGILKMSNLNVGSRQMYGNGNWIHGKISRKSSVDRMV